MPLSPAWARGPALLVLPSRTLAAECRGRWTGSCVPSASAFANAPTLIRVDAGARSGLPQCSESAAATALAATAPGGPHAASARRPVAGCCGQSHCCHSQAAAAAFLHARPASEPECARAAERHHRDVADQRHLSSIKRVHSLGNKVGHVITLATEPAPSGSICQWWFKCHSFLTCVCCISGSAVAKVRAWYHWLRKTGPSPLRLATRHTLPRVTGSSHVGADPEIYCSMPPRVTEHWSKRGPRRRWQACH